jgi:hypothetical protein
MVDADRIHGSICHSSDIFVDSHRCLPSDLRSTTTFAGTHLLCNTCMTPETKDLKKRWDTRRAIDSCRMHCDCGQAQLEKATCLQRTVRTSWREESGDLLLLVRIQCI